MKRYLMAGLLAATALSNGFLPTSICFAEPDVGEGTISRSPVVKKATKKAAPKAKAKKAAKKKGDSDSDIFDRSKYVYEADKEHKTANGRASVNNGDRLAQALTGKTGADMKKIIKANGLEWNPAWDDKNEGMQKMNASNRLRAKLKRGEKVTVDGKTIASLGGK